MFVTLSVCACACGCMLTHGSLGAVCVCAVAPQVGADVGSSQWGPVSGEPSSVSGPHKQSSLQGREKEGGMAQIREDTDGRSGERERERRKEDFRSYVMWACTAVLPKAISPNSNQHRHNKNTPAPREMYSLGYEHTTFLKGLFEKPDTIMIVFSSSNVWGWGEIKRDERDVSNGRKWWFLDGRVYHALSITDRIAGSLECRVSVCNKVTFLFHWQLMKTDPHCQIYALHLLTQVLYDRERRAAHNNKIQAEGKWEAGKYFTVQFAESIQGKAGRRQQHYWRQGITLCSFSVQTTRGQLLSGTIVS